MSGRAGRRGLDDTGVVIIACSGETPPDVSRNFACYAMAIQTFIDARNF
jgi:superfamily II RNA helicase